MRMRITLTYCLAIIAIALIFTTSWHTVLFAQGTAKSNDWYQWRGPNRDGISSEKGWSATFPGGKPKILWELSVGKGFPAMSVSNGRAYTVGNLNKTDTVYCLDANTGEETWKYSYQCPAEGYEYPGPASTPTVDGDRVYTLSREGHYFCFDSASGKIIWSKDIIKDFGVEPSSWRFASSPLILDNMVIVEVGMTLALDKSNGNLIWKTKKYGGGYSSPFAFQLDGKRRLAIFNALGLVILDAENGKELMQYPWKTDYDVNAATPIVSGDKIFISSGYNTGCALLQVSRDKLSTVWKNKNMRNHFNSCILWQGHLYGFDESQLRCLDFQTGEVKWTEKGLGKGALMIADGKLIIQSEKGELVIAGASPNSFNELSRAKVLGGLCWTVPVLSNGKIYCRDYDGKIVCLDVSRE